MAKHRIPPAEANPRPLRGPNLVSWSVGEWCPTPDGTGPATAVGLSLELENGVDIVLRLKTPRAVDDLVQMLLRHKRGVWPEAP